MTAAMTAAQQARSNRPVSGRPLRFRIVGWVTGIVMMASCGAHGRTIQASAVPAPSAVLALCDAYGTQLNRPAANQSATTAGAVADSMRAAHLDPTPWATQTRNEQVARCEYPLPGNPRPADIILCPHHTFTVKGTLYYFLDAQRHRTAIPDALLGPACSRK